MKQKINAIVFSRDRAPQLKLFLDSINKYAPDVFDLNVIVSHTNEDFDKGYGKVVHDESYNNVNFLMENKEFKEQVLELLKTDHTYSCFFLDDDILYNEVKFEDVENQMQDDDVVCFSLRLGDNVTNCYTLGAKNVMHDIEHNDGFMKWDWKLHYLDFGYPFAMDGHIFRRKDIHKLVRKSKFTSVEELEMSLFDFAEMFPRNLMTSYEQSALVGVPLGRVQVSLDNDMASAIQESKARVMRTRMNTSLLENTFINLESIDFSNIDGCHKELDLGIELTDEEREGIVKISEDE